MDGITFAYELPPPCPLQQIPFEIADLAFRYTLDTHQESHLPLLLTSKHVNQVVTSTADTLARRRAGHERRLAAVLFSPRPRENLLSSWLPRISRSVDKIETILLHSTKLWALHVNTLTEIDATLSILSTGLYLIESMNFDGPHKATEVRLALFKLPAYGVLLIRLTSVVLTMMLSEESWHGMWYYDTHAPKLQGEEPPVLNSVDHFEIFALAVESQLLKYGVGWVAETLQELESVNRIRCLQRRVYSLALALRKVAEGMYWLCRSRQNEGILRAKMRDEIVSARLRKAYGELQMAIVAGARWEGIRVMMRKVEEEIAGRDEKEVLMEMKIATGLQACGT